MQSSLSAKIHSLESSSLNKTLYYAGMVTGDAAQIAADIFLTILSGGASAGLKAVAKSGDTLVLVSGAATAAATAVAGGAVLDAFTQSTNLGKDLDNLITQIKRKSSSSEHMIGENGTQVENYKAWQNGKTERLEAENPDPGERPGQIHYHDSTNKKWMYDIEQQYFYDPETGQKAPREIQKLLKNPDFVKKLNKALKVLGELK